MSDLIYRLATFFAGSGGSVAGYAAARVEALGVRARFESVIATDCWPTALETCARMTGSPVQLADLFDYDGYVAFHGHEPPPGWRPMTPADLRAMCPGGVDVVFASPPCKGFSRLLGANAAKAAKYGALNSLVFRWLWLVLEAWPERPPRLVIMENVPDIADPTRRKVRRGEALVQRVEAMLASYGYASRRATHDCGPLGGLAQTRRRFLLVGRHVETCAALLYEPFEQPMKTIGDVIGDLPLPCFENAVPGNDLPNITRRTEQRLAFVEPGSDWRSIEATWSSAPGWAEVERGGLRWLLPTDEAGAVLVDDPRVSSSYHGGAFGVVPFDEASGTVTGGGRPSNGAFTVADPRPAGVRHNNVLRLGDYDAPSPCVTGGGTPTAGGICVADPRVKGYHAGVQGVLDFAGQAGTVTGQTLPSNGAYSVADPRLPPRASRHTSLYSVRTFGDVAHTVTGNARVGSGAAEVADPRLTCTPNGATLRVVNVDGPSPTICGAGGVWTTSSVQIADPRPARPPRNGTLGVQDWCGTSPTVTGSMDVHNGAAAVSDPRRPKRPRLVRTPLISPSGFWHRPLSVRELADLQSFPRLDAQGRPLIIEGGVTDQRMQIGNAVPPDAACAVAEQMLKTLLSTDLGTGIIDGGGIWVRELGVLRWYSTSRRPAPSVSVEVGAEA